ncbi:MAG: class I SAM-dependent methyltransferase [Parachlamydiales bacterium]|nr:class I SAM-dependent methyltransferase [Verrucomicrobiota bacterium]MBX3718963.1 class I SAM-dependent methyltransferase [Candidatus Acheromyda pituitae]
MMPAEPVQVIEHTISHQINEPSIEGVVAAAKAMILERGNLPYISAEEQCRLVDEMCAFEFGRFLLKNKGLNGYWTHYLVVEAPKMGEEKKDLSELEQFFLFRAPTALATQERYTIFQREMQKRVKDGCVFASVPCGLMADLIDLDFSAARNVRLVGIDLDAHALRDAERYACTKRIAGSLDLRLADAWELNCHEEFDLLTSNGLNIYEPSDQKVILLFKQFFDALKPGGVLIASYMSFPPIPGMKTEWNLSAVNGKDALLQKIILVDILKAKLQAYRSRQTMEQILNASGFDTFEIIEDRAGIFPVIVAKKQG